LDTASELLGKFEALNRRNLTCNNINNNCFRNKPNESSIGISQDSRGDEKRNKEISARGDKKGNHP